MRWIRSEHLERVEPEQVDKELAGVTGVLVPGRTRLPRRRGEDQPADPLAARTTVAAGSASASSAPSLSSLGGGAQNKGDPELERVQRLHRGRRWWTSPSPSPGRRCHRQQGRDDATRAAVPGSPRGRLKGSARRVPGADVATSGASPPWIREEESERTRLRRPAVRCRDGLQRRLARWSGPGAECIRPSATIRGSWQPRRTRS